MRASSFITDIVKRHVTLPVNEDLTALKVVLRDWVTYTEHVSLQQKPTYAAELHIDVLREAPSASVTEEKASAHHNEAAPPTHAESYLHRFFHKKNSHAHGRSGAGVSSRATKRVPHVYRKVVPLALWSAVLPWEVQRGLSLSTLALPPTEGATASGLKECTQTVRAPEEKEQCDDEEEDTLGVVSTPVQATVRASLRPTPGMLFLMDAKAVDQHKGHISFWSGAIMQPIDVLFVAPAFAASVAPSTTFGELREARRRDREADLHDIPQVQSRFFPHGEMQRDSTAELRVTNFGHLDPFPHIKSYMAVTSETTESKTEEVREGGTMAAHTVAAATPEARYVVETLRHTLRDGVQTALAESRVAYTEAYPHSPKVSPSAEDESAVEIRLTLELSDALRRDLQEKAQLAVQYVEPLEDVIAHHARRLNTPVHSSAEAEPVQHGSREADEPPHGSRKVRVWLSETESVWMTAHELAAHQAKQMKAEKETPREAQRRRDREAEEADAADERAYEEDGVAEEVGEAEEDEAIMTTKTMTTATHAPSGLTTDASVSARASARASATNGWSPLTDAASAQRSIARQSPMLKVEDEGRPSYLAPSFTGRHAASSAAGPQGIVVSANKLARYPETHSAMPVLPPIDYDLFDLTVRLGVGYQAVLFHYHPRILREWRQELRTLTRLARNRREDVSPPTSDAPTQRSEQLDDKDVLTMLRLVRDPSLQLPEDLITLVEAVAHLKEQVHQRPTG